MRRAEATLAAAVLAALAACNPYLGASSAAPPGREARLAEVRGFWGVKSYRLELSQGIAIAITCDDGGPCEHLRVTSDAPAIAEVRPAALDALEPSSWHNAQPTSAFVIIGEAPGTTHVRVRAKQGHRDVAVTVVPPPAPPAARVAGARPPISPPARRSRPAPPPR